MIITGSQTFARDINRLKAKDAPWVKGYVSSICQYIRSIDTIDQLVALPLANCFVYEEGGKEIEQHLAPGDRIFRITFERFSLFIAIHGGNPITCSLLALEPNLK